ncbi:MAG: SulP family inorganic anion transporter [Armatimonadota bacterium]
MSFDTVNSSRKMVGSSIKADVQASLVVFLIAVPLSLGIALASGAPIMGGLIAAVIGGIVIGGVGGSPLQVSGPAAGLTVLVYSQVQQFGWPVACAITAAAGALQLLFGTLKIARGALVIAPSVVHGMMAGIGIVITLAQIHEVLGGTPESSALKNIIALPAQIMDLHGAATILGIATFAVLMLWKHLPKAVQKIPGALVTVVAMTAIATLLKLDVRRVDLPDGLFVGHQFPELPKNWGSFSIAVVTVAIIASVESLLCAVAVDKLHSGKRTNFDRELIGQGLGNLISGLLGGLPVTGVIVRSSANAQAGAKTNLSAVLHGVWIALFAFAAASWIELIPRSVLAGLLIYAGVNLVNVSHMRELGKNRELGVYFVTVLGVVFTNLLYGVITGVVLTVLMSLRRLSNVSIKVEPRKGHIDVVVNGSMTFVSVPKLGQSLAGIEQGKDVHIVLAVDYMDHAAFEVLSDWIKSHKKTGARVTLEEMHEEWYADAEKGKPRFRKDLTATSSRKMFFGNGGRKGAEDLIERIRDYEENHSERLRPTLSALARDGQVPKEMFITCCDSRVLPHQFTSSGPGDLFKIRNIGNMVPRSGEGSSVGAALEYAVSVLGVERIVVCGHSGCGAMNALLNGTDKLPYDNLKHWLSLGQRTIEGFRAQPTFGSGRQPVDQLSLVNVVEQLDNLMTYEVVKTAVNSGTLSVLGLFFDIDEARVYIYDNEQNRFLTVDEIPEA